MKTKVLQVFYNENGLPFKDQARTVHFPITGSGFQGASNTTQIKFYFGQLGDSSVSWVAVAKLPNGKIGSKVLETYSDSELGEPYALLELNSFYTQYKGDVFISLQGYEGGVNYQYDDQTDLYEIYGTPTIQATGSIKFTNNYATQFVGSGEEDTTDMQELLALLGLKANKSETISRYTSNFSAVTLQTLYDLYGYKLFILNTGSSQYIDYLMQFQVTSGTVSGVTLVRMTDLREWHAEIGSGEGQLPLSNYVSALQNATYLKHIATEEYLTQYYVPYTGANSNVDLGNHTITANQYNVGSNYYQIGLVGSDLVIGTFTGDIYLQPEGKLYYGSYEVADKNFTNTTYVKKVNYPSELVAYTRNHGIEGATIIANYSSANTIVQRRADKTVQVGTPTTNDDATTKLYVDTADATKVDKVGSGSYDRLYGVTSGGTQTTYNISQSATANVIVQRTSGGKINAGVVGSTFSNTDAVNKYYVDQAISTAISTVYKFKGTKTVAQLNALTGQATGDVYNVSDSGTLTDGGISVVAGDNVVWTGSAWDKLAGEIDLTGYYNKTQVDTLLSAKADISTTVIDNDIIVSGGYVTEINKGGTNYPIAENVDITTIPKVVQSTTDLPATNDGYLYLVLDNGYLYHYVSGTGWTQAYQYTSDLLTITTVVVDED